MPLENQQSGEPQRPIGTAADQLAQRAQQNAQRPDYISPYADLGSSVTKADVDIADTIRGTSGLTDVELGEIGTKAQMSLHPRRGLSFVEKATLGLATSLVALGGTGLLEKAYGKTNFPPLAWIANQSGTDHPATQVVDNATATVPVRGTKAPENPLTQMNAATLKNANDWLTNPDSAITHAIHQHGGTNLLRPTFGMQPDGSTNVSNGVTSPITGPDGKFNTQKYYRMQGDVGILGAYDAVDVHGVHHTFDVIAAEGTNDQPLVYFLDLGASDGSDKVATQIYVASDLSLEIDPPESAANMAKYLTAHVGEKMSIILNVKTPDTFPDGYRNKSTVAFQNGRIGPALEMANEWLRGTSGPALPTDSTPVPNFNIYPTPWAVLLASPVSP